MGFPTSVADDVMVRCSRHCCLCGKYAGVKMELHHIKQVADGGDDTADNCIPLCFDCHAEVKSYNPHHPKGKKFTEKELKEHRDKCYKKYSVQSKDYNEQPVDYTNMQEVFKLQKNTMPISWGYYEQDRVCPIYLGNIVLIAGYANTKKSTYLHHIVNYNLKKEQKIVYCCIKDNLYNVACEINAEKLNMNPHCLKRDLASCENKKNIFNSQVECNGKNLSLISYENAHKEEEILNIVNKSDANIVVIDDFNGITMDVLNSVEHFFYKLKNVAAQKNVLVFVIYNITIPVKRPDMHPILDDFPSENYYRLFDVVQLLYRPSIFYIDERDKEVLEIIIMKGTTNVPYVIKMVDF